LDGEKILTIKLLIMWFEMLLGHLTGDYLLQNDFLAKNKANNDLVGWLAAFVHCLIYTFAVCFWMWNFQFIWIVAVFCSHFFIDKFAFGKWYLKHVKQLDMEDYRGYYHGELHAGFTAVIYTVTDNAMHLILMWGAYKLLY
jgi:hypothetical protein